MASSKEEQTLKQILSELDFTTPDIIASAIISTDGNIITSTLPEDVDVTEFASVGKTLFLQGNRLSQELGSGTIEQISLACQNGLIFARNAGQHALLFLLLKKNPKLGLVIHAAHQAAKKIVKSDLLQPGNSMGLVILNN